MIAIYRRRQSWPSSSRSLLAVRARVQHYSPPAVRSLVYDTLIRRTRARARLARERTHTQTLASTTQTRVAGGGRGVRRTNTAAGWAHHTERRHGVRCAESAAAPTRPATTTASSPSSRPRACVLSTLFRYTAIIGISYGPRNDYLVASLSFFSFSSPSTLLQPYTLFTPTRFTTHGTRVCEV